MREPRWLLSRHTPLFVELKYSTDCWYKKLSINIVHQIYLSINDKHFLVPTSPLFQTFMTNEAIRKITEIYTFLS
jgi:hypothetical protein